MQLEIKSFREVSAEEIAERSGGQLEYRGAIPWDIHYQEGHVLFWRGFPRKTKGVYEAVPFLMTRDSGSSVRGSAVLLKDSQIIIVNGGPDGPVVTGAILELGEARKFKAPFQIVDSALILAKNMALGYSTRAFHLKR